MEGTHSFFVFTDSLRFGVVWLDTMLYSTTTLKMMSERNAISPRLVEYFTCLR